ACSPQAWAAGAPLLAFRVLLGLEPRGDELTSAPALPEWVGALELRGIPGRWGRADVAAARPDALSFRDLYRQLFVERGTLSRAAEPCRRARPPAGASLLGSLRPGQEQGPIAGVRRLR